MFLSKWKNAVRYDFFSQEWIARFDYVVRTYCAELKDDPNLIGYFYSNCSLGFAIEHTMNGKDLCSIQKKTETKEGSDKLYKMAKQYYKTIHDAIRKYNPNQLILWDRYEANSPIAIEVIEAASPFVNVLSFQDFQNSSVHLKDCIDSVKNNFRKLP